MIVLFSFFFTDIYFRSWHHSKFFVGTYFRRWRENLRKPRKLIPAKVNPIEVLPALSLPLKDTVLSHYATM